MKRLGSICGSAPKLLCDPEQAVLTVLDLSFPLYRTEIMTAHISKAQSGPQTSKAPYKHELILSQKTFLRQGTVAVYFYR